MRLKIISLVLSIIIITSIILYYYNENNDNESNKISNEKPNAIIEEIQYSYITKTNIEFIGIGNDPDGKIVKYEWDFDGDGVYDWKSNVTGNATYIYWDEGTYNVSFKVTDNDGDYDIDYQIITITKGLPPVHDICFDNLENGYTINSTFNITGRVKKSHSEDKILSVQISINNSNWINISYWEISHMDYKWHYIFNTTIYPNGDCDISIKAVGYTYGEIVESIMVQIKN